MYNYEFEIAISLCKQDVEFARKLINGLNPGLKVFFYEDRQEELISTSGPESFAKIFKERSRIVIILSRNEWSETYYTDIERNAIIDRTSVRNQGYDFLIVIPMEPEQTPSWFPSTRIYIDPRRFSIEQIAKFIEFKVTDKGGVVIPLTSEDVASNFIERLKAKRQFVLMQSDVPAIEKLTSEVQAIKELFNLKANYFAQNRHSFSTEQNLYNYATFEAYFGIHGYVLNCTIQGMDWSFNIGNTQQVLLIFRIFKRMTDGRLNVLNEQQYRFFYSEILQGWSPPIYYSHPNHIHLTHLFKDYFRDEWYDLKAPISTEELLDNWFSQLWELVKKDFAQIL